MEFHEKLQELRKIKGLTQEELAKELYVSRTAISKWESGRGYPSIDSLKAIANYFDVTIDDLLSGEKILSIAEKENKTNIRNICDMLFGIADILSLLLIILPLYPNRAREYIYSVNLFSYTQVKSVNYMIYWIMFIALILGGIIKIVFTEFGYEKGNKIIAYISMIISVLLVLFLAMTREVYAIIIAFLLFVIKGVLYFKCKIWGG